MGNMTIQTRILHGLGDACLMISDIASALGLVHGQVSQAAAHLIARGLVERLERGCFRLTDAGRTARDRGVRIDSGVTGPTRAPRQPRRVAIRQRAWNAMRIKRTFTVPEITTAIAREGDGDVQESLRRYFNELAKDGYLVRAVRRQPGTAQGSNGFVRFSLVRDTGPLAPVWSRKLDGIHDFNLEAPCNRI